MALPQERTYTMDDIDALPEGIRAELIDGQIYYMSAPSTTHQKIVNELSYQITHYVKSNNGKCQVYPAPFAVFIKPHDDRFYVEPDINVICDPNKINNKGCKGAPDWIIEITSPSTVGYDLITTNIYDDFYPKNEGKTTIKFINGIASILSSETESDVEMCLDISDFSSLIVGSVDIMTLYRLGLLKVSDKEKLTLLDKIFGYTQKPLTAGRV